MVQHFSIRPFCVPVGVMNTYGWTGSEDKEDATANEVADVVDVVVLDKAVSLVLDEEGKCIGMVSHEATHDST